MRPKTRERIFAAFLLLVSMSIMVVVGYVAGSADAYSESQYNVIPATRYLEPQPSCERMIQYAEIRATQQAILRLIDIMTEDMENGTSEKMYDCVVRAMRIVLEEEQLKTEKLGDVEKVY